MHDTPERHLAPANAAGLALADLTLTKDRREAAALDGLERAVAASAPLVIRETEYDDPVLVLIGPEWSLALACPWHIENLHGTAVLDWEAKTVDDAAGDPIGLSVRAAEPHDAGDRPGTALVLSNGHHLIIEPDSDVAPGVMQLPAHVPVPIHVLVGPWARRAEVSGRWSSARESPQPDGFCLAQSRPRAHAGSAS